MNTTDLFASLEIMWKGMLGLFVVCGFIMLLIMGISKFTVNKTDKNAEK
jgi:CHASE3 domain sensor protein